VLLVFGDVAQIVYGVNGAGDDAVADKGQSGSQTQVQMNKLAREEQWSQNEDVLEPLMRTHKHQQRVGLSYMSHCDRNISISSHVV